MAITLNGFTDNSSPNLNGLVTQVFTATSFSTNDSALDYSLTLATPLSANSLRLVVYIDGLLTVLQTGAANGATNTQLNYTGTLATFASQGAHTIKFVVQSKSGNTWTDGAETTAQYTVTYDATAPMAPAVAVIDDVGGSLGTLSNSSQTDDTDLSIKVTFTGTGAAAGDTVKIYDSGVVIDTHTITASDITNGYTFQTGALTNNTSHTYSANIIDQAANAGASSATTTVTINTVCFLPGTLVATPQGERAIETLQIGDLITLADGRVKPVKWLGCITNNLCRFNRSTATPVLIRAGALGNSLPKRDLYTTYHHGFEMEGVLMIAGLMVNGTSIMQCTDWPESQVMYYQVEVEGHELMLVEGCAAETFGESWDNRESFDNAQEFHRLYPQHVPAEQMAMGRVAQVRQIPRAVSRRIETAATRLGYAARAAAA